MRLGKSGMWLVLILAVGVVILAVSILGCVEKIEEPTATPGELQGTIKISGAFALYPMMEKWKEEFEMIHPSVRIDLSAGGAGKGMTDVLNDMVDIGMVSREIYPQELEKGAFWVAVTKDAVVPTMNVNNPVSEDLLRKGITKRAFEDIWITGNMTTWGEVVGTNNADKIAVYTRSDSCGAAEEWAKYLGNYTQDDLNEGVKRANGVAVYGDPGLAEAVRKDPLGIGYNNLNYAYDAVTGEPVAGIRIIPIDLNENGLIEKEENFYGTKSELQQAIGRRDYPSPPARDLNLVTKGKPNGLTKEFIAWCLTEGQQYVTETGYIPLPEDKLRAELEKIG